MNLYDETVHELDRIGLKRDDVEWVACPEFEVPLDEFWELAKLTEYNRSFGVEEVAVDVVVMTKSGTWLERRSYDGSEWWVAMNAPQRPKTTRHVYRLSVNPTCDLDGRDGLARINGIGGD